jgi:hypothetical protein
MNTHNSTNDNIGMTDEGVALNPDNGVHFTFKAHRRFRHSRRFDQAAGSFSDAGDGEFISPRLERRLIDILTEIISV